MTVSVVWQSEIGMAFRLQVVKAPQFDSAATLDGLKMSATKNLKPEYATDKA